MTVARETIMVARSAFRAGVLDYLALHRWSAYLAGWIVRLSCQVMFFALISDLIGIQRRDYLLVGNAVAVAGIEGTMVVLDLTNELKVGTFQALLTTPATTVVALFARTAHWVVNGVVTGCLVFLVVFPAFQLHLDIADSIALPFLLAVSTFGAWTFGCVVSALLMWRPTLKWLGLNVSYLTLLTFCGVNVPTNYWPSPIHTLTQCIPFTWGLTAVRQDIAGAPAGSVLVPVTATLGIGALWILAAAAITTRMIGRARRVGSIDFA